MKPGLEFDKSPVEEAVPWMSIFAFFFIAALAFFILAFAAPRRYQVKVARVVPAPPERVWAYVSEPRRFAHWFPSVVECTAAGSPARGVGQRRRVVLAVNRRRGEREEEATAWEENRLVVLRHLSERRGGRPVRWEEARSEFRLEPAEGGTRVTGVLWFSGRGMRGRIFSLLRYRKLHEQDFRAALAHLEKRLREESYPA